MAYWSFWFCRPRNDDSSSGPQDQLSADSARLLSPVLTWRAAIPDYSL